MAQQRPAPHWTTPHRPAHEEGSGSVLILALCMAIILAASGVALLWAGALTSTRAQNAADMAAYAGASSGSCAPARTIAQRSGMEVLSCKVSAGTAEVELQARLAWVQFRATASAHALTLSQETETPAATSRQAGATTPAVSTPPSIPGALLVPRGPPTLHKR